jgi:hypothetical protein
LKTRVSVGSEGASGSHRRLILVEIWWAMFGDIGAKSRRMDEEERFADSSFSLETTCLGHSHPAMKKTLLGGIKMASLENAYSRLARISLTFARDKVLKVQLKRGREVSMSYLL